MAKILALHEKNMGISEVKDHSGHETGGWAERHWPWIRVTILRRKNTEHESTLIKVL